MLVPVVVLVKLVMLKITFLLLVKMKLEEVVICTGCVLIDIILLKVLFYDNERKENIAGLSSSLSTFNEMEKGR
jgi:hypothetical protein